MKNYLQTLNQAKATIAIATIAVVVLGLSSTAAAEPKNDEVTIKIDTAHLDASNEAGAAVLYRKIKRAATKICGDSGASAPINQRRHIEACIDDTIYKAVYNSGLPMLVAAHTGELPVNTLLFAKKERTQKTP